MNDGIVSGHMSRIEVSIDNIRYLTQHIGEHVDYRNTIDEEWNEVETSANRILALFDGSPYIMCCIIASDILIEHMVSVKKEFMDNLGKNDMSISIAKRLERNMENLLEVIDSESENIRLSPSAQFDMDYVRKKFKNVLN
jgi:hypothetical protein